MSWQSKTLGLDRHPDVRDALNVIGRKALENEVPAVKSAIVQEGAKLGLDSVKCSQLAENVAAFLLK